MFISKIWQRMQESVVLSKGSFRNSYNDGDVERNSFTNYVIMHV